MEVSSLLTTNSTIVKQSVYEYKNNIKYVNNKQYVLLMVDLLPAFDAVAHDIFLHRLQSKFSIKGKTLPWL